VIRFALRCTEGGHEFECWFRSNEDFDRQAARDLLSCPVCGSGKVGKALMRPAVAQRADRDGPAAPVGPHANEAPPELLEAMRRMQELARKVRAEADYVGRGFAEEARRIHYGDVEERRIYGEASGEEVRSLLDEGITAMPLPPLPEDAN
jgi:hypothetical protein